MTAETPLAQLRKLIDELDKEVHRIGAINTAEDRERTLPELTVWSWLQRAKSALLTDLEAAPPRKVACPNCGLDYATAKDLRAWKDEPDEGEAAASRPAEPPNKEKSRWRLFPQ